MGKPLIYLYSASPRRRELLNVLNLPFEVIPADADERIPEKTSPQDSVTEIASRKLEAGLFGNLQYVYSWGIAADTLVEGPGGLLGKPSDEEEAAEMLSELSGRQHSVHTGLVVYAPAFSQKNPISAMPEDLSSSKSLAQIISSGLGTVKSLCHTTTVTFRDFSKNEIRSYIRTGEWRGAAGAYRIQGKGAVLLERIEGLWSTVVGLPLAPLYGILTELSYPLE